MNRYLMLGLSTVFVVVLFFGFSDEDVADYDYSGIVYDVRESSNGFTFSMDASDGTTMRCFCRESVFELGYYALSGDFSSDGTIYFVKSMKCLDKV